MGHLSSNDKEWQTVNLTLYKNVKSLTYSRLKKKNCQKFLQKLTSDIRYKTDILGLKDS